MLNSGCNSKVESLLLPHLAEITDSVNKRFQVLVGKMSQFPKSFLGMSWTLDAEFRTNFSLSVCSRSSFLGSIHHTCLGVVYLR